MMLCKYRGNRRFSPARLVRGWAFLFDDILLFGKERNRSFKMNHQFFKDDTSSSSTEKEREKEGYAAKKRLTRLKYLFHLPIVDCTVKDAAGSSASAEDTTGDISDVVHLNACFTVTYPLEELHLSVCLESEAVKKDWLHALSELCL